MSTDLWQVTSTGFVISTSTFGLVWVLKRRQIYIHWPNLKAICILPSCRGELYFLLKDCSVEYVSSRLLYVPTVIVLNRYQRFYHSFKEGWWLLHTIARTDIVLVIIACLLSFCSKGLSAPSFGYAQFDVPFSGVVVSLLLEEGTARHYLFWSLSRCARIDYDPVLSLLPLCYLTDFTWYAGTKMEPLFFGYNVTSGTASDLKTRRCPKRHCDFLRPSFLCQFGPLLGVRE